MSLAEPEWPQEIARSRRFVPKSTSHHAGARLASSGVIDQTIDWIEIAVRSLALRTGFEKGDLHTTFRIRSRPHGFALGEERGDPASSGCYAPI